MRPIAAQLFEVERLHLIDVALIRTSTQEPDALAIRLHDVSPEPVRVPKVLREALVVSVGVSHSHGQK